MVVAAVSPWIVTSDADGLLTFLAEVYGAREVGRAPGPEGRVGHAETVIAGTTFVVVDALDGWAAPPAFLRLHLDDLDDLETVVGWAVDAGARVVSPPTALPQGVLAARLVDPWGNLWWLEQQVEVVEMEDLMQRLADPAVLEAVGAYDGGLDAEMRARS